MSEERSKRAPPATAREPTQGAAPDRTPTAASSRAEIDAFLSRVNALGPVAETGGRGRLVFALDATMSRQPTWDQACVLQADMFREAAAVGGLDIQLVYYRGLAECRASPWVAEPERLGALMSRIDCRGGHTQIAKILAHAKRENDKAKARPPLPSSPATNVRNEGRINAPRQRPLVCRAWQASISEWERLEAHRRRDASTDARIGEEALLM